MLCSRQDVLDKCFRGDAAEAAKLARVGAGGWDPALFDGPIRDASADVADAAFNKYGPLAYSLDPSVYPVRLRKITALRTGHYFWLAQSGGIAEPENIKTAWSDSNDELARLMDGKQGIAQKASAPRVTSAPAVDTTAGETVPRMTLNGFRVLP